MCHDKTDRSHLFLERVNGEALTMCSKPLIEKGRCKKNRFGVVKFVVDFAVEFWACKQRVSGGEKISARFSPSMTTVPWDPRKSPWISPFQNLFLTKIEFHGNFVCMRFSLQILPATFFATNFASKFFCRHQFFAGAVFRRHRFSPAAFFAALTLHAGLKNTNSAFLPPFQKGKQSSPKLPLCTLSLLVKIPIFIRLSWPSQS